MPTPAVGIDLGTTNSVVAVSLNGKPQVLVDPSSGSSLIPSVVSFTETGERLVGRAARARKAFDPANTISSVKRLLGRPFKSEEVRRARSRVSFDLKEGADSAVLVQARGGSFSLPEISAMVLREVRRVAEHALDQKVDRCVVTVPANFNELQRSSTKIAGKIAELEVVRILNEPTAAALAYGYGRGTREKICIYDFGGGTFDVTLLELNGNVFEVLSTWGDTFLGGDDIDVALTDAIVPHLLRATRVDATADRLAYDILRDAVESAKCRLSQGDAATIDFNYQAPGARQPVRFQHPLSRADLERLASPYVEKTFSVCQEALKLAGLRPGDLTAVILVGGSTRIHSVRTRVAQFFGREPLTHLPPEEVVGLGASILAEALTGGVRKGPTTQRMFAAGAGPSAGASSGSQAGPLPTAAQNAAPTSAFRAGTIVGTPPAPPRPPPVTSAFRGPTPPPVPQSAQRSAPPPLPPGAKGSQFPPPPPGAARSSVAAPPPSMPSPPRNPTPVPMGFDLDDPFADATSDRTSAVPVVPSPSKKTPMPAPAAGIGDLDEPSFVGKAPVPSNRQSHTRPFEQPVPAFNLDDPSMAVSLAAVATGTHLAAREEPYDPEPTQAFDVQAELPATVADPALPAVAPDLPSPSAALPAAQELPVQPAPPAQPPSIVKPPIGARPRPSSPNVQPVLASPDTSKQGGLAAAMAALPPSIAAAIKPPPPKADAPMFAADDERTRAMPAVEDRSVPSFQLDPSALFGDPMKDLAPAERSDLSVPSFRIDADDIFGPSHEAGTGTLVARSPFEPTLPETGSSTVALEAPPVVPQIPSFDDEPQTRKLDALEPPAPPRPEAPPARPSSTSGETTRVRPAVAEDPILPPMVVPPPVKAAVPPVRSSSQGAVSPVAATIQGGSVPGFLPPSGGDTLKPGLPPAPARPPVSSMPPAQPLSSVPPSASQSGAPPRVSVPGPGGIAVPLLLDVTPLSLGVETAGGLCESVIRRNATIPVEQTRVFATTNDEQTTVVIRISQGESRKFSENQTLGELELSGLRAAPRGEVAVAVTFELGADGTLNVRARDVETGREQATRVSLLTLPTETAQAEMAARQRASALPSAVPAGP